MKIAIHDTVITEKPKKGDAIFESLAADFKNVDYTIDQLAAHIGDSKSFSAWNNGRRSAANFICCGALTVDIDKGLKLADMLANPFVQKYAAIVYRTQSHTEEHNRFRIVFALERDITDPVEMKHAFQGGIREFGGDESCKDACRLFYGCAKYEPIVIGNYLPNDKLAEMIEKGATPRISAEAGEDGSVLRQVAATRSTNFLKFDEMVRTEKGAYALPADLQKKTSVHCPRHIDNNASAFIVESRGAGKTKGVHCSKCSETFWPASINREALWNHNFFEIDSTLHAIEFYEDPFSYLDLPDGDNSYDRVVQPSSGKWLEDFWLMPGITLIRSPKGSGKTQQLKRIVARCKRENKSVLLIGHRQALLSSLCKVLGLDCYLDTRGGHGERIPVSPYFGVSLDSIRMLNLKEDRYDVIIIDESEQVFSHVTSDTLKEQRRNCFLLMQRYIKRAEMVLACDADLSYLTLATIGNARGGELPTKFHVNRHKDTGREIEIYEDQDHLLSELIARVGDGEKCYVCCNSKKKAEQIEKTLLQSVRRELKMQLITSSNSQTPEIRRFVENIKEEILDYDVVISSPSLGTGIDITFKDGEKKIDAVFGFFIPGVNTHFDMDQQLCRVRNPKAVKVWISPEKFTFETEPDVIKRNCIETGKITDAQIYYDEFDNKTYVDDDDLLSLYAEVLSHSRASKNNLLHHFTELKVYNGWTVKHVAANENDVIIGSDALRLGKETLRREYIDMVCAADVIKGEDVSKLKNAAYLTLRQQAELDRFFIEKFYDEKISPELVALDDNGRYQNRINLLAMYLSPEEMLVRKDDMQISDVTMDREFVLQKKALLRKIFDSAGLLDVAGNFDLEKTYTRDDMKSFKDTCFTLKVDIQSRLNISLRSNLAKDPMKQLSVFLNAIGCRMVQVAKKDHEQRRIYHYQFDANTYQQARNYAETVISRRQSKSGGYEAMRKFRTEHLHLKKSKTK